MEINLKNFAGEIEWFKAGDYFFIDKENSFLQDLIEISRQDIVELSSFTYNQPIDEKCQVPQLKFLLQKLSYRYEQLYISDAEGNYFNADGQKNNIKDRFYFKQVMKGQTVVSEPIINRSTGKPVIAVATPIWCNGKVTGLFGATILITSCHKGLRYLPLLASGKRVDHKERNNRGSSGKRAKSNVQFVA